MKRLRSSNGIAFILVLVITLILLFPIYWMFVSSLLPSSVILSQQPPLFPPLKEISLTAYDVVFTQAPLLTWMFNSIIITAGSTIISMAVSVLAGYSLSRFQTRGQFMIGFFLLVNRMIPGTLLIIPLFIMFNRFHLLDNPTAVILANLTIIVPFTTWMMKGFIDGIPKDLEESAIVDGCSRMGAFSRVILPLTAPGLAATSIYAAILAWSDFLFPRTLLTSSEKWTLTMGTVSFIGEYMIDWSSLMAMGMVSVIPMFILFVFLEPYLVSGMTSGSVKG